MKLEPESVSLNEERKKISFSRDSIFNSLDELLKLPKKLSTGIEALTKQHLSVYYVNRPPQYKIESEEKKLTDYGVQRLVVTKKVDKKIYYLEINNWGIGADKPDGEIFAFYEKPEDLNTVNEMLNIVSSIFPNNTHGGNMLKKELGDGFKFEIAQK